MSSTLGIVDQGQGHGMTMNFFSIYHNTNCQVVYLSFGTCKEVYILMLYISAMDHARKLKFSSYIHLPSINKMFQYRYA